MSSFNLHLDPSTVPFTPHRMKIVQIRLYEFTHFLTTQNIELRLCMNGGFPQKENVWVCGYVTILDQNKLPSFLHVVAAATSLMFYSKYI